MRLLFCLLVIFPVAANACYCAWTDSFCAYTRSYFDWTEGNTTVARVRLLKFANASRQGYFPLYDLQVLEVYAGSGAVGDRVSLLGQDGGNCNGGIPDYRIGEEYIVMFPNTPDSYMTYFDDSDVNNPYPIFDLPGCGPSVLTVGGGRVTGDFSDGTTGVPLRDFRERLADCLGEYVAEEGTGEPHFAVAGVDILPNPATVKFTVRVEQPTQVFGVGLYDMIGHLLWKDDLSGEVITEYPVSVAGLPAGVYVIVMETDGLRIKEQVIVQ